jgi:hypothetical protein
MEKSVTAISKSFSDSLLVNALGVDLIALKQGENYAYPNIKKQRIF